MYLPIFVFGIGVNPGPYIARIDIMIVTMPITFVRFLNLTIFGVVIGIILRLLSVLYRIALHGEICVRVMATSRGILSGLVMVNIIMARVRTSHGNRRLLGAMFYLRIRIGIILIYTTSLLGVFQANGLHVVFDVVAIPISVVRPIPIRITNTSVVMRPQLLDPSHGMFIVPIKRVHVKIMRV